MTRTTFPGPVAGRRPRRTGAILLVVLALLALFAVIGLSFALYAESEANAARIHRDAVARQPDTPPDPTQVVNSIFQQAVYGTTDQRSAFRGHDMVTGLYGGLDPANPTALRTTPYSGVGTFSLPIDVTQVNLFQTTGVLAFDRKDAINYAAWDSPYANNSTDTAAQARTTIVDPETAYVVTSPTVTGFGSLATGTALSAPTNATGIYVPKNAPYTYPDRNNAMLALLDPTSGLVRVVSGHRDGLFNDLGGGMGATNPNWYNVAGHFKTLRPRPFDHLLPGERSAALSAVGLSAATLGTVTPAQASQLAFMAQNGQLGQFPYPVTNPDGSTTGDVQNLIYSTANPNGGVLGQQRMDAVWINPNLPLATYKGKTIATLVAPTLIALDPRVNVNVAGNLVTGSSAHGSHSGFGPHEINLGTALESTGSGGSAVAAATYARQIIQKRYGTGTVPPAPRELPSAGSGGDAEFLAGMTAGTGYPYYPLYNKVTGQVFAPKTFHPLATPAARDTVTGTNNAGLKVNQQRPSSAMPVNWLGAATALSLPASDFKSDPTFTPTNSSYDPKNPDADNSPLEDGLNLNASRHPLLWNPYRRDEFAVGTSATRAGEVFGLFPVGDLRSTGRYADRSARLQGETFIGSNVSTLFGQDLPVFQGHHATARTTPFSNSRAAGGLAANFLGDKNVKLKLTGTAPVPQIIPATGATLQLNLARLAAGYMDPVTPAIAPGGMKGDPENAGANDANEGSGVTSPYASLASLRARLGPVDLNRPLADYRTDPAQPFSGSNIDATSEKAARLARQQLATDIFTRLAVVTGASIRWDGAKFVLPTPQGAAYEFAMNTVGNTSAAIAVTVEEYDALRWLAQYAANVVDAIDVDDISTPFVWNAPAGTDLTDATQYSNQFEDTTDVGGGRTALKNRVVYGVEKPRVVLNEVLLELANDEGDRGRPNANSPFQVRLFAELLNPGSTDDTTPLPKNVPLAKTGGGDPQVYRLQVFDKTASVRGDLTTGNANVRGAVTSATAQVATPLTNMAVAATTVNDSAGNPVANPERNLEPNNGAYIYDGTNSKRQGFGLVGPGSESGANTALQADPTGGFSPNVTAAPYNMMIQKKLTNIPGTPNPTTTITDNLAYFVKNETALELTSGGQAKNALDNKHAVVLQRTANPYLDFNATTNPYLTVDAVYDVKVHDGLTVVKRPAGSILANTPAPHTPTAKDQRHSLGRVQPFAGAMPPGVDPYAAATTRTSTLTLKQQPTGVTNDVQQTFFRHNGLTTTANTMTDTTLDFPFEWLVHPDRRFINGEELLHVATVKPHELTFQFARPGTNPAGRAVAHLHTFQRWVDPNGNPGLTGTDLTNEQNARNATPLYRALDLLTVKPWVHDVPLAGRMAGRINVNLIDEKVFRALVDRNGGSSFTATEVDTMWNDFKQSRSPSFPNFGNTTDEATAGPGVSLDRPFKGFGTPRFEPGGNLVARTGPDDTLLRTVTDGTGTRLLFSRPVTGRTDQAHPYRDNEALRKILNNVTTTSDTFLLVFTVGYFEVRAGTYNTPSDPIVLGKEVFNNAPGDLRAKFAAVIDRTHLTQTGPQPDPVTGVANAPWNMDLQAEVASLSTTGSVQMLLPAPLNRTWNGTGTVPQNAELQYNVSNPSSTGTQDEYFIIPQSGRFPVAGRPIIPPGTAGAYQELALAGRYEGRDFVIRAHIDQGVPPVAQPSGTQFYIGTGRKRTLVRANYDGTTATQWRYNPVTGRATISVQVISGGDDGTGQTYAPGTILSSVVFGSPSTSTLDVTAASPVIPFFTRLTP